MFVIPATTVTAKQVADLVVGAFEGGSNTWLHELEYLKIPAEVVPNGVVTYSHPEFWAGDFELKLTYDNPDDEGTTSKVITPADVTKGLAVFASKYPSHYSDWLREEDDADTSDAFMQCLVLGDIVYG